MAANCRAQALKQLKLKAVIKESHCSPVQHLEMNLCDADCRNLFATVGKDQVTIYDDMHMGDHVAVVGNLALSNTVNDAKDLLYACCWIKSAGLSRHPYGDALLAVGGSDANIHIISIVEAAVVGQLPLPAGTAVAELSAAVECPGLLLVLCRDGTVQLWQISSGACLWSCKTDAFAAAMHPSGGCVLTSSRAGKLTQWDLASLDVRPAAPAAAATIAAATTAAATAIAATVSRAAWLAADHPDGAVDCVRFLTDGLVCVKTADGHMSVHSWPSGKTVSSWKVPGCGSSTTPSYSKRCSFGHTSDGHYVCVGNQAAAAYVYDARTGRQVSRVEAIRVQGAVKACGLSEDCRHLLMVAGHGYVFRFEARPALEAEDAEGSGSDTDMPQGADDQQQQPGDTVPPQQQQQQHQPSGGLPQQQQQHQHQPAGGLPPQQQQQPEGPATSGTPTSTAATPAARVQQQQQQQQYTPGGFASLAEPLSDLEGDVTTAAATFSTGSLDALMGCDTTPQGEGLAENSEQQQQRLSGGLGGVQHKRQRVAGRETDDSPLIFRPTPQKQ